MIQPFSIRPPVIWSLMGPFFASKNLRKEMPYLSDEPGYTWFISTHVIAGEVVRGFVAVDVKKDVAHIHGLYVIEAYRKAGVGKELIQAVVKHLREGGVAIHAVQPTASRESFDLFKALGFIETSSKGSYRVMSLKLEAQHG